MNVSGNELLPTTYMQQKRLQWSQWQHSTLVALLPLLLAIAALIMHILICRVLWINDVDRRQWRNCVQLPLVENQVVLLFASLVAVAGLLDILSDSGELLLGRWVIGDSICRMLNGFRNVNYFVQTLIGVFLLVRVATNRSLLRQLSMFLVFCYSTMTVFFVMSFSNYQTQYGRCILNSSFLVQSLLYIPFYICELVLLIVALTSLYIVKKRRANFTTNHFHINQVICEIDSNVKTMENISIVISIIYGLGYAIRIIGKMLLISLYLDETPESMQTMYLIELTWESCLALSTGFTYFQLYPDFKQRLIADWCHCTEDSDLNENDEINY